MLSVDVTAEWEISAWFHWQASRQHSALLETVITQCMCYKVPVWMRVCVCVCMSKCVTVAINLLQVKTVMCCQVHIYFFCWYISNYFYSIWEWICHFVSSNRTMFQKAAHLTPCFLVTRHPVSSLLCTNAVALFSAAYLHDTSKAL